MNKIDRYLDSLLDLPAWIGLPIFCSSLVILMVLVVVSIYLLSVTISPWFILLPVVIWAVCALTWWLKNKGK